MTDLDMGLVAMNSDLRKERESPSFCLTELTHLLDGGKDKTARRKEIESVLFQEALFSSPQHYFRSQTERYSAAIEKAVRVFQLADQHQWSQDDLDLVMRFLKYDVGVALHKAMFIPSIERLGTEEQKAQWLPLAKSYRILGTYAQTELGHGTYLKGFETTATYDSRTEEFILRTPTLSAQKYWPGSLGKSSTHAVVMAQLLIDGVNHGLQFFIVQLRSLEDHMPLKGVSLGIIGPKVGLQGVDNGYLVLDDVRIPRDQMLMRYAQVSRDGVFHKIGADKASYGTMVVVRVHLMEWVSLGLSQCCTIAIRYSAVRRQCQQKPGGAEVQVLDYQTQQYKLFPCLATAYAFWFMKESLMAQYQTAYTQILSGNFSLLAELHSQSSGLKAFCSDVGVEAMELCRRSCGGHGYLLACGIPEIYADLLCSVTVEGENTVLYLQTAKYLLKCYMAAESGETLPGSVSYLAQKDAFEFSTINLSMGHHLLQLYRRRALWMVKGAASAMAADLALGKEQHAAWDRSSVLLVKAAKAHLHLCVVRSFVQGLDQLRTSLALHKALERLCLLYCLHGITENSGDFLKTDALSVDQLELMQQKVCDLLSELRPDAVSLVDAFDWHDSVLNSALGAYDGNVYERLTTWAKQAPLNQSEVDASYYKYLQPLLTREVKSKL